MEAGIPFLGCRKRCPWAPRWVGSIVSVASVAGVLGGLSLQAMAA
jgi:hypothetical protein